MSKETVKLLPLQISRPRGREDMEMRGGAKMSDVERARIRECHLEMPRRGLEKS